MSKGRGLSVLRSARTVFSPYPNVQVPEASVASLMVPFIEKHGDLVALQCSMTGDKRTYSGLLNETKQFAASLQRDLNFGTGSAMVMVTPNHASFPSAALGCMSFGGVVSPANPLYGAEELYRQVVDANAKAVLAHSFALKPAQEAAQRARVPLIILDKAGDDNTYSFPEMASSGLDGAPEFLANAPKPEDLALLPFSSGTTGLPKGVMLTHRNLVANIHQAGPADAQYAKRGESFYLPLPFFHIYGFGVGLGIGLMQGSRILFSPKFDLMNFLETIQNEKVTRTHVVPPIVNGLLAHPAVAKFDLSSLRTLMSAAAPLGAEQETALASKFPGMIVKQAWGMTELSPAGTIIDDSNPRAGSGSVGQLVPNTSGRIIDPETEEVLFPDQTGEIVIKGPQVMKGYLNRPEDTEKTFTTDGYMRTGDIGYFDEDGFLYVTDRCKELIKYKGMQVAPAELESLLLTHPEITDAVVIPRPCAQGGEVPRAYVVMKSGIKGVDEKAEQEVKDFVAGRVAPHKKLRGGVRFTDQVPKSASGKLLRREVREADMQKEPVSEADAA